ncbi:MAG: FG-GAP-like repeat-containing protein, partial [Actinomycetota bacterium]
PAGTTHRFALIYEAGPEGVAPGGRIFPSPEMFWEWSPSQNQDPRADGYVTAEVLSGDARLEADGSGAGFVVAGAALAAGDRVRFVYGAGERGARVDRYAEREAGFSFAVDADGDGDLDLVVATAARRAFELHLNDGSGRFVDVSATLPQQQQQHSQALAAGDVDGDGDQDLWVGVG